MTLKPTTMKTIWLKMGDHKKVVELDLLHFSPGDCPKCKRSVADHGLLEGYEFVNHPEVAVVCPGAEISEVERSGEITWVVGACYLREFKNRVVPPASNPIKLDDIHCCLRRTEDSNPMGIDICPLALIDSAIQVRKCSYDNHIGAVASHKLVRRSPACLARGDILPSASPKANK